MRYFILFFSFMFFHFIPAQELPEAPSSKVSAAENKKETMLVEPKQRSQDFLQAYEMMKKGKAPTKVIFLLMDGTQINNVLDVTLMKNGTLLLLKVGTALGHQLELVRVENLSTIVQL